MLARIRKSKIAKVAAVFLGLSLLSELFMPSVAFALTGGPSQPEVQSFEPVATSEMVDIPSGDFLYNIPLVDVGGYPINISYHSGITTDQEASWVGLGWNINPGVINRTMRGIPDDFSGSVIKKSFNIKNNHTFGVSAATALEIFGFPVVKTSGSLGIFYNNYKGIGFEAGLNFSKSSNVGKMPSTRSLGLSLSSESGIGITANISMSKNVDKGDKGDKIAGGKVGLGFNSRQGLQQLTFEGSLTVKRPENAKRQAKLNGATDNPLTFNGGSSISFASSTYVPQVNMPMVNASLSFTATLGGEIMGAHPDLKLTGYYSGQYLASKEESAPAYGYLYGQEGSRQKKVLLDFNREKDGAYTKHTPNLPVTNHTYDIYSVSGQGIGGMYRPFRNDIGIVYDSEVNNSGGGGAAVGIEFGGGVGVHGGLNVSLNYNQSGSGKWSDNNEFAFSSTSSANANENVYFKQAGEKTAESDPDFVASIGGVEAVRVDLANPHFYDVLSPVVAKKHLVNRNGNGYNPKNGRSKPQARNQAISFLNAKEAAIFGVEKTILSYEENDHRIGTDGSYIPDGNPISRTSYSPSHISEIRAGKPDGTRYIYGIPAYNTRQDEVSFAIQGVFPSPATGLTTYDQGADNSTENKKGLDHYFNKVSMPAYAHSYLLTVILSPDYVDSDTIPGPSEGDMGTYTKFNYTRAVTGYKWRVPFEKGTANHNEGMKSVSPAESNSDDKGSYLYGEKDIWYLHSVETKTQVAEFVLEDRADGYGVEGENGGIDPDKSLKRLKEIRLFSKTDKRFNANPTPLKTVHFVYDYSLCSMPGGKLPNNTGASEYDEHGVQVNKGGKLTLKKIFFTYGNSYKARLSPYIFQYSDFNPGYNLKAYDRWGNYKENKTQSWNNEGVTDQLSTSEFPYTDQDSALAAQNASAWNLTTIQLPSGGVIHVTYEADDYAYVQDKRAMQMFTLTGFGTSPDLSAATPELYSGAIAGYRNYVFFKLQKPLPLSTTQDAFRKKYLYDELGKKMDFLYFRCLINLNGASWGKDYEYVPGYAKIADGGLCGNNSTAYTHGYVQIKDVSPTFEQSIANASPIALTAWQFAQQHLPRLVYKQGEVNDNGLIQIAKALLSSLTSIQHLLTGFNRSMRLENYAKEVKPAHSFIRLFNPEKKKYGGGLRVKKITSSDEWTLLTGNNNYETAEYGQEYDYTVMEGTSRISSGVASYEPTLGGDENPWRQPSFFEEEKLLVPDDEFQQERPFGESFFPSPSVVYSRVTVRNLQFNQVNTHATGEVVHEFYTAKDFPTIVSETDLKNIRKRSNPVLSLLKLDVKDFMTVSQGYAIELNDMHGKPKAQWVYNEAGDRISGVKYDYKQGTRDHTYADRTLKTPVLDNKVNVIRKNASDQGFISQDEIGVDYDIVTDMRESYNTSVGAGLNGNLDAFLLAIFPALTVTIIPDVSFERIRFRSAVTTKVINRYGLIDKITAYDLGSAVETRNLVYDAETGEVLLTEVSNQFRDPVYSFTYPAHWAYDRMGPAYKNEGASFPNLNTGSVPNARTWFVEGDEVMYNNNLAWVSEVGSNYIKLIDVFGQNVNATAGDLKILRSGRRNMQTMAVGSIVSLSNPVVEQSGKLYLNFRNIIDAKSVEFTDKSRVQCECMNVAGTGTINPYAQGLKGNWRAKKSYLYLTGRTQTRINEDPDLRHDGIFTAFSPFWKAPSGQTDWVKDETSWTWTSEITEFSPYGFELENQDALQRYSAALYGYNNTLPKAVASNTRYRELAFDGFEDYDYNRCDKHFNFHDSKQNLSNTESHSGRKSILVKPGTSLQLNRIIKECDNNQ